MLDGGASSVGFHAARRGLLLAATGAGMALLVGCSRERLFDATITSARPVPGQDDRLVLAYVSAAEVPARLETEVVESAEQVRVRIREWLRDNDSTLVGHEHTTEINLAAALGNRSVVDAATGALVEVVR